MGKLNFQVKDLLKDIYEKEYYKDHFGKIAVRSQLSFTQEREFRDDPGVYSISQNEKSHIRVFLT